MIAVLRGRLRQDPADPERVVQPGSVCRGVRRRFHQHLRLELGPQRRRRGSVDIPAVRPAVEFRDHRARTGRRELVRGEGTHRRFLRRRRRRHDGDRPGRLELCAAVLTVPHDRDGTRARVRICTQRYAEADVNPRPLQLHPGSDQVQPRLRVGLPGQQELTPGSFAYRVRGTPK